MNGRASWLDRVILGLLIDRDMCGYEMAGSIGSAAPGNPESGGQAGFWVEGRVYPALRRLERAGILCGHWLDPGSGAPRRRYYSLTPRGVRAARAGMAYRVAPASNGARP